MNAELHDQNSVKDYERVEAENYERIKKEYTRDRHLLDTQYLWHLPYPCWTSGLLLCKDSWHEDARLGDWLPTFILDRNPTDRGRGSL